MTTLSTRLQLLKPDDGGPGGDDTVNVTTQLSDNFDKLDAAVGIIDYTGAKPAVNNFIGRLCRNTATGEVFRFDGALWKLDHDTQWQTWATVWSATNDAVAVAAGTLDGRYFRIGKKATVKVDLLWGAGTNGGTGNWSFTGPPGWALTREHKDACDVWISNADYPGLIIMTSGGAIQFNAANSASDCRMSQVRNSTHPAAVGTGVPQVAGSFTYGPGANLRGTLEVEVTQGTYDAW